MNNIIHFMARLSLLYSLLWSISIHAYAHSRDTDPNSTYPTPDRLFHIARKYRPYCRRTDKPVESREKLTD